jgi:FtsH-binding integral membrane protein
MTWRAVFAFVLVVMIAASIGMAVFAVERSPGWTLNPGAAMYLREAWFALLVYAGAIVVVVANRGEEWDEELQNAARFGTIAGLVKVANIVLEHARSAETRIPALNIAAMLIIFVLWALAGARTARDLRHFRPGVIAAVMSAGVCMVIAVTAGFAVELFISPPRPDLISTWEDFKRSGWIDAHAFGIASTLDSAFSRLWMGPAIALAVGAVGAGIGKMTAPRR